MKKHRINGNCPDESNLYPEMNGLKNLDFAVHYMVWKKEMGEPGSCWSKSG